MVVEVVGVRLDLSQKILVFIIANVGLTLRQNSV